ncbi:MAG: undecaprenyl-diphosphate phosphatase [Ruminococcus sp.]|uniref:undecaprenyl-diphosphate phosphatase n=1 Tax=Ruminococcus sp. TaxID=41978 RepID=UPI002872F6FA|nr:undecaprenyl-diphosphate phosphatase [Ruminococcus sp.]MBQ3285657.1 undecaprenyl-diphosphate phosphatase [Ruminococcus sp.]
MTIVEAIIQGAVQGLTEFLPVSSSGHLTITQHVLGIDMEGGNLFFNVMLHIGTLVAVIAFYHKLIWRLIKAFFSMIGDIFTGKFKWKELSDDKRMVLMVIIGLIPLLLLFIPIPGTDMKLKDLVESFNTDKYFIVVGICLLITSLLLFIGSRCSRSTVPMKHAKNGGEAGRTSMNVLDAITIGITQCFATLPGLSRSGSTLSVGQMRGLNKQTALDYTFILGTPAIIAAALLEGKDALEEGTEQLTANLLPIIIGMVVAAVVGYLAIALFKWLLKTDKMIIFIIYTAVVGLAVVVISIIEMQTGVNLFSGAPLT